MATLGWWVDVQIVFDPLSRYGRICHNPREMAQSLKTFLPDKELRPVASQISMALFGTTDIRFLNVKSKLRIARELRHAYAATVKQISRMVYMDPESLNGFI